MAATSASMSSFMHRLETIRGDIKSISDSLDFSGLEMSDEHLGYLIRFIKEAGISFTKINLANNLITDKGSIALIAAFPSLEDINLAENRITKKGATELFLSQSLRVLDLSGNRIGSKEDSAEDSCCNALEHSQITNLILSECWLTSKDIKCIGKNKTLKDLNLSDNQIREVSDLAQIPTLVRLNLAINSIQDISAFHVSQSLIELTMTGNTLNNHGVRGLCKNNVLKILNVARNKLNIEGLKILLEIPSLTKFDAFGNDLLYEDFLIVVKMAQDSPCLIWADFTNDNIPQGLLEVEVPESGDIPKDHAASIMKKAEEAPLAGCTAGGTREALLIGFDSSSSASSSSSSRRRKEPETSLASSETVATSAENADGESTPKRSKPSSVTV